MRDPRRPRAFRLGWMVALLALAACHRSGPSAEAKTAAGAPGAPEALDKPAAPVFFGAPADGKLHLHFFDVGRGSAALLVSPTGKTVLIDTGPKAESGHLVDRLPQLLRAPLDWVVITDPRSEHVGGLPAVLAHIGAKGAFDSEVPCVDAPCALARSMIAARHLKGYSIAPAPSASGSAKVPRALDLGGGAKLEILWPRAPRVPLLPAGADAPDVNALVLRLVYRHTSVLFASDMRTATEEALIEDGLPLRSTLLVVGDHGSERANSAPFLLRVAPQAAILSPGPGEDPAPTTLARLRAIQAEVFRTDQDGGIHAVSDGETFTLTTERALLGQTERGPHRFSEATRKALPTTAAALAFGSSEAPGSDSTAPQATGQPPSASPAGARPIPRWARYVASKNSHVFHLRSCRTVRRIKPDNLVFFRSLHQAEASHRRPSQDCMSGARAHRH